MPTRTTKSITQAPSFLVCQRPFLLNPVIEKIEGYYGGSVAAWLQFHDPTLSYGNAPGVPTNGTVPFREMYLGSSANGFLWQYMRDSLRIEPGTVQNGVLLAVSITQGTLTLGTGTTKASFMVSIEEYEEQPVGTVTIAGDMVTGVNILAAWVDSNGPGSHTPLYVVVSSANSGQGTGYLQMFAHVPSLNEVPLMEWTVPVNTPLTKYSFGESAAKILFSQTAQTGYPLTHTGGFFGVSTTPGLWDLGIAPADYTIQVAYI